MKLKCTFNSCWSIIVLLVLTRILPASASTLQIPEDLSPGDTFHWVFVTSTTRDAVSSDISVYNQFVNNVADAAATAVTGVQGISSIADIQWKAIASVADTSAKSNLGTLSSPIYTLAGSKVADNSSGLFSGGLISNMNILETGDPPSGNPPVWTGSDELGDIAGTNYSQANGLMPLGASQCAFGYANRINRVWAWYTNSGQTLQRALYAISEELTVPEDSVQRTLTLDSTAGGAVHSPGEGAFTYNDGTSLTLTAQADPGYVFDNWSGDLISTSNPTSVSINANMHITANFAPIPAVSYDLVVGSTAGGFVSVPGEGSFSYEQDTQVAVVATAQADYDFVTWTGTAVDAGNVANVMSASTTVTMDGNYTLQAEFAYREPNETGDLRIEATAGGAVRIDPGGQTVTGPGTDTFSFDTGTAMQLHAEAHSGYRFTHWSGSFYSTTNPKTVTITESGKTVKAHFKPLHTLRVASSTGGIIVRPYDLVGEYLEGSTVTIVAKATDPNSFSFVGWEGSAVQAGSVDDPNALITTVTMYADYIVEANFMPVLHERVHFVDANLQAAVEVELGISNPTATDMFNMTSLDASGRGIVDLTGLEHAVNLAYLNLAENQISEASVLSGLTNLEWLLLNDNQIMDLTSLLLHTSLRHLDVTNNPLCAATLIDHISVIQTNNPLDEGFHYDAYNSKPLLVSAERGFYEEPFDVEMSTSSVDAMIIYTLDGSDPRTSETALTGKAPVTVKIDPENHDSRGLTPGVVLRACVSQTDCDSSEVVTHTYLFIDNVKSQAHPGGNWPTRNVNGQELDWEMDQEVVNDPRYSDLIDDALTAIPTISLVTDMNNLFDSRTGIYVNAHKHGREWERPTSVELLNPGGSGGFQINAGLRIRGGWSRHPNYPKHAFRLFFRGEYGAGKLRYPMFGSEGTSEFDKLDLRTSQNYAWSAEGANGAFNTMNRDVFSRDLQKELGQPYTRSRYYHLYVNGLYWGLFQTQERSEARYGASYLGGNKDDYDVVKVDTGENWNRYAIEATDGNLDAWSDVWEACSKGFVDDVDYFKLQGLDVSGQLLADEPTLVNIDNLIDYMLIIFYTGNFDAPVSSFVLNPNNFYAVYNRNRQDGFIFFAQDNEHTLLLGRNGPGVGLYEDRVNLARPGNASRMYVSGFADFHPQWLHHKLSDNAEYRMTFADHVYRHFFNHGAMTSDRSISRFMRRANEIDLAIIAESARWGDAKNGRARTRDDDWLPAVNDIVQDYFPYRTSIVLSQLKEAGLYPDIDPVAYKQGSNLITDDVIAIDTDMTVTLANPNDEGSIFYTLDGTDPRQRGGGISPGTHNGGLQVDVIVGGTVIMNARVKRDDTWSVMNTVTFVKPVDLSDLIVTELHYHPLDEGAVNSSEYEFIELKNIGTEMLDLSHVAFTDGIGYTFPVGSRLPAGAIVVLASNSVEFENRYGFAPFGEYTGQLANGGEQIVIQGAAGDTIVSFRYHDDGLWPTAPDGDGYSLMLKDPSHAGDPGDPANWIASTAIHGSPGWYSLSISSTSGGTVILPGEGDFEFVQGDMIVLQAAPDDKYTAFVKWSGSAVEKGYVQDPTVARTQMTIAGSGDLVARFEMIDVSVDADGELEIRGQLYCDDPHGPLCLPGAHKLEVFPDSGEVFVLERLVLQSGVTLSLADHFRDHPANPVDVLYVRDLVLAEDAVLNLAGHRLYYETLTAAPSQIVDQTIYKNQLAQVNLGDPNTFDNDVATNNTPDHTFVSLVDSPDIAPEPVLYMQDHDSVSARAKTYLGRFSEDEVFVSFSYLFNTDQPDAILEVYLSDKEGLLPLGDSHMLLAGRFSPPILGCPGSMESGLFAFYTLPLTVTLLDPNQGLWLELVLSEPPEPVGGFGFVTMGEGARGGVYGRDLVLSSRCLGICMDLTGDGGVTPQDYTLVGAGCGRAVGSTTPETSPLSCIDQGYSRDGYVDSSDLVNWGDLMARGGSRDVENLCSIPMVWEDTSSQVGSSFISFSVTEPMAAPAAQVNSNLLFLGKGSTYKLNQEFLSHEDLLYGFDDISATSQAYTLTYNQGQMRLVRGDSNVMILDSDQGLCQLNGDVVVGPGRQTFQGRTVTIGIRKTGEDQLSGRPLRDVVFHNGFAYVVPVIVEESGGILYQAAAKLELTSEDYQIRQLYYDSALAPFSNQSPNLEGLREIEVDGSGRVYLLNAHYQNSSDMLWAFDNTGALLSRHFLNRLRNNLLENPVGLCFDMHSNRLYIASGVFDKTEPNQSILYGYDRESVLSGETLPFVQKITIGNLQHITDISSDQQGTIWVTGFEQTWTPEYLSPEYLYAEDTLPLPGPRVAQVDTSGIGTIQIEADSLYQDMAIKLPTSVLYVAAPSGPIPVALWRFDELGGGTARDETGSNPGTIHGAVPTQGIVSGALQFDGTNDYVACGNSPDLVPEAMTLSMWVYPDVLDGYLVHKSASAVNKEYELSVGTSGLKVAIGGASGYTNLRSSDKINAAEWSHVAFSYGEGVLSVYINGVLDASKAYSFTVADKGNALTLGGGNTSRQFQGRIDHVGICDRVLSDEEILGLFEEAR